MEKKLFSLKGYQNSGWVKQFLLFLYPYTNFQDLDMHSLEIWISI